jgi:hypothetical protein
MYRKNNSELELKRFNPHRLFLMLKNSYYSGVGKRLFDPSFTMNTDFSESKML